MKRTSHQQRRVAAGEQRGGNRVPAIVTAVVVLVGLIIGGKILLAPKPTNAGDPAEVQFEQALAQKRVIYALYHSTTCIPCKEMERVAADVMPEFAGKVTFVDVNVYDQNNLNLLRREMVRVIPTNIIYDRQGQSRRYEGVLTRDGLRAELQAALSR
ncbi:MAG: thioredoxin domain-containing protein [Anaerolineae bacterium]